ncbi:hypothetical protein Ancab_031258 [Ancistrocladus abbreviatus]
MQKPELFQLSLILLIAVMTTTTQSVNAERGMVGARMKIRDVKTNKEVQDMGRFSVEQFNRNQPHERMNQHIRLRYHQTPLKFEAVVEAEKQVVAGIKYYLKINAAQRSGVTKTFDAVVVVVPWLQSKKLLSFAPTN